MGVGDGTGGHVLDNAVWHAALGPRRHLVETRPGAARFDPDVAPFSALPDEPGAPAWADLGDILGAGGATVLFRASLDIPEPWTIDVRLPGVQMIASEAAPGADDQELIALGADDVDEMLALVAVTRPGPFGPRTVDFGGYLGMRVDGRLVAMAGERMRCGGFTEISAVCTAPEHRGKGLAGRLVLGLVGSIRARGEEAFLHAAKTNTNAIRLYETLGFTIRREIDAVVVRAPS
ncbi:MAG: GNAT family N-acetyltransferase [Acidimicrobiales bacterium]